MKLSGTILFSIIALQQVMNYAVQAAPRACSTDASQKCNTFKNKGETCICADFAGGIFILKCEVSGANPQDKKCKPKTDAYNSCFDFCNAYGYSCTANDDCVPL